MRQVPDSLQPLPRLIDYLPIRLRGLYSAFEKLTLHSWSPFVLWQLH